MTNQKFLVTRHRDPRDLPSDARREGAALQSQNPQAYYRVKVVHMHGGIVECSKLARRPKNLKYTPEIVTTDEFCETLDEARTIYEARVRKAAEQPETVSTSPDPKQDAVDGSPEGFAADPTGDKSEHLQAILDYMARSGTLFGPKGKGQKTAIILLLLHRGLGIDEVVAVMQELDTFWSGAGKWTTTKGTVVQRRRGLRINGWEVTACVKYHIPAL